MQYTVAEVSQWLSHCLGIGFTFTVAEYTRYPQPVASILLSAQGGVHRVTCTEQGSVKHIASDC